MTDTNDSVLAKYDSALQASRDSNTADLGRKLAREFQAYRKALALSYFDESVETRKQNELLVHTHFARLCELSDTLLRNE